jgi:hypothetical protein
MQGFFRLPSLFAAAQRASVRAESEEPQQDVAVPRTWRSNYALYFVVADFPLQLYVRRNSIVYINQATNNSSCVALCDCNLWFAVVFEDQNDGNLWRGKLAMLLVVMEVKRYAVTSLWCAYAAVASVIILAYFWRSHRERPFLYAWEGYESEIGDLSSTVQPRRCAGSRVEG